MSRIIELDHIYIFQTCKSNIIHLGKVGNFDKQLCTYQCQAGGGWGSRGIGRDFDESLWPGLGCLNYLAVPGIGIFQFLFVPVTTNHFPGWGISVIFDLTFLPWGREFDNFKNPPCVPPPLPHRLGIDRCISTLHIFLLLG